MENFIRGDKSSNTVSLSGMYLTPVAADKEDQVSDTRKKKHALMAILEEQRIRSEVIKRDERERREESRLSVLNQRLAQEASGEPGNDMSSAPDNVKDLLSLLSGASASEIVMDHAMAPEETEKSKKNKDEGDDQKNANNGQPVMLMPMKAE